MSYIISIKRPRRPSPPYGRAKLESATRERGKEKKMKAMTKKDLIAAIEDDGRYYNVKIESGDIVTGVPVGEPSHYHAATNTGGRRLLGKDTELLAALVEAGEVDAAEADTYTNI